MPCIYSAFAFYKITHIYVHHVKVKALDNQLCLTLGDPMDCSLPGFSVHGILQERIQEWVTAPFSGDLPNSGIKPGSPALHADFLPSEPAGKPHICRINLTSWFAGHRRLC